MNDNIKAGAEIHAGDGGYSEGTKDAYDEFVKGRNRSTGKSRIKELAEQATSIVEMVGPQGYASSYANFDREKFAELIVTECIEQIWYTREDGINGNVSEVIKDRIKQHFGVEE